MSMTDPVADLLTRIRNASMVRHKNVSVPHSVLKERIAMILKENGFVRDVSVEGDKPKQTILVTLKYATNNQEVIQGLERISKPGRRVYVQHDELKPIRSGMGVAILSTSKGIMSDSTARLEKCGGEWLANIW